MKYLNWKAICEISRNNDHLAIGLASLNLSSELGQKIADSMGSLFLQDEPPQGPIPWSWLVNYRDKDGFVDLEEACQYYGIPKFLFYKKDNPGDESDPVVPDNLDWKNMKAGDLFIWHDEVCVVLFTDCGDAAIDFTLARCVDLTR